MATNSIVTEVSMGGDMEKPPRWATIGRLGNRERMYDLRTGYKRIDRVNRILALMHTRAHILLLKNWLS